MRPGERVRLVHELRELRGAEELLQRRDDRPDVDDRLRRDRVDVLRRHPLADDALHAVEADAERLLDQLADRAQAAVAEVLVLVELAADRVARERDRVGGEVLRVLGHAERASAARRACGRARGCPASSGRACPRARRRRAAGSACSGRPSSGRSAWGRRRASCSRLRALSSVGGSPGRCFLKTSISASSSRVVGSFSSVLRDEERVVEERRGSPRSWSCRAAKPGRRVLGRQRAQQRRDRQLALPVDAGVDDALLVDLELEPRAAGRHQVRGEDLLRRVLRLHQVGARASARAA